MEKFFIPRDRTEFIMWLLQKANENGWTMVFEYSRDDAYSFISKIGTQVPLPNTSGHQYDSECRLTAFINISISDNAINQIMLATHVLSVHNKEEMLFLIADDFHEDCFSSSIDFYNNYQKTICDTNLADIY
jgi:hypothetical protein